MKPHAALGPIPESRQRHGMARLLFVSAFMALGAAFAVPALSRADQPPAVAAMAVPYYVAGDGESRGPVGLEVLLDEIADGIILPWTLVWKPGLSGWIKAAALPELGAALAAATPRPPPPPPRPPAIPAETPTVETVYFIADGGVARGPLTEAEVSAAIAAGEVTSATLVWWPGAEEWAVAGSVSALTDQLAPVPPPIPAVETVRQLMVGTWEFLPELVDTISARTVLTFAPDMTFSGSVAVSLEGAVGAQPVGGTWSIGDVDDGGFSLVLRPDHGAEGATRLRIVDRDVLETYDRGTTARRVPG